MGRTSAENKILQSLLDYQRPMSPEEELRYAVLEDAMNVIAEISPMTGKRQRGQTRRDIDWLLSDNERWPFSFLNICEVLNINPTRIRKAVEKNVGPLR